MKGLRRNRRDRHGKSNHRMPGLCPDGCTLRMRSKGEQYSKIFRRAGIAWGKDDVHKAMAILQEGLTLAVGRGDADVARVMQADLERYQRVAGGGDVDLSR